MQKASVRYANQEKRVSNIIELLATRESFRIDINSSVYQNFIARNILRAHKLPFIKCFSHPLHIDIDIKLKCNSKGSAIAIAIALPDLLDLL